MHSHACIFESVIVLYLNYNWFLFFSTAIKAITANAHKLKRNGIEKTKKKERERERNNMKQNPHS